MLLIECPWCGVRPENEFHYGGEAHIARPADPAAVDDAAWTDFLYMRTNPKGRHAERWRHIHGCGRFFNGVRDTVSDRVLSTYQPGELPPS
ncbi:MAG TPA: sarcosine oxidase subunit delta [Acetobacteraceae bacterium]|jgi:sarcosine oxidase subunit delta|nr:sarcosine oxidase subunit delta [Acetobacteraceae bacterium]